MNKTYVIGMFVLILLSTTAYAHPGRPGDSPAQRLTEELNLDDVQANSIAMLFENAKSRCDGASSRSDRRECMEEQRASVDDQISALLTKEQLEQFQELKADREERRSRSPRAH